MMVERTTMGHVIDSDAYGVNTDLPETWQDNFRLTKEQDAKLERLRKEYDAFYNELLVEAAHICGLDTSDWDTYDWWDLEERVELR